MVRRSPPEGKKQIHRIQEQVDHGSFRALPHSSVIDRIAGNCVASDRREFYPKQFQRAEIFFEEAIEKLTVNALVQPWWKRVQRGAFAVLPDITPGFVATRGKEKVLVSNGSNLIAFDSNTENWLPISISQNMAYPLLRWRPTSVQLHAVRC
jgi:hypothetical protein